MEYSEAINDTTSPLPLSWMEFLGGEFKKDYMLGLKAFLKTELEKGKAIYPHGNEIFEAYHFTPFSEVKVVIIGQDPYHGPGQAHGASFSVKKGVRIPPSLLNIYKEIERDLGIKVPSHGYLKSWALQGVLLLNNVLTVEGAQAASHQGKGWEQFTDKTVEVLNQHKEKLVFILWGSHAQKKGVSIDQNRHLVLKSPHPSPLSAHRGFMGCGHFSQVNHYLKSNQQNEIDWIIK